MHIHFPPFKSPKSILYERKNIENVGQGREIKADKIKGHMRKREGKGRWVKGRKGNGGEKG